MELIEWRNKENITIVENKMIRTRHEVDHRQGILEAVAFHQQVVSGGKTRKAGACDLLRTLGRVK